MEIHVVRHPAVFGVLKVALDSVADPHTDEGIRHTAIEGPEGERAVGAQMSFELNRFEIDTYCHLLPPGDRWWDISRIVAGLIATGLRLRRGEAVSIYPRPQRLSRGTEGSGSEVGGHRGRR